MAEDWEELRKSALRILQEEAELQEIVRLVGLDTLSKEERIILETARPLKEDFLHQNAYHEIDTYSSLEKQYRILSLILKFHNLANTAVKNGTPLDEILALPIREKIAQLKLLPEKELSLFSKIERELVEQLQQRKDRKTNA